MNTGAEDDRRSTPIFAFSASSARAIPLAPTASKPASASRQIPFIRSLRLQPFRHLLVPPDEGALLFQLLLQLFGGDVSRNRIARQRQRGGTAGGFPHRKAGAGDPRRRLPVMGHRSAAAGNKQIVEALRH